MNVEEKKRRYYHQDDIEEGLHEESLEEKNSRCANHWPQVAPCCRLKQSSFFKISTSHCHRKSNTIPRHSNNTCIASPPSWLHCFDNQREDRSYAAPLCTQPTPRQTRSKCSSSNAAWTCFCLIAIRHRKKELQWQEEINPHLLHRRK